MLKKSGFVGVAVALSFAVVSLWLSGCSSNDSAQPLAPGTAIMSQAPASENDGQVNVNLAARIATIDQNMRRLTFVGIPDTVEALADAEIVRMQAGVETQIQFGDLAVGDSVHVCAYQYTSTYWYAERICAVGSADECGYDVAFRAAIESIDYANSTLIVEGRPETILVDENTEIWAVVVQDRGNLLSDVEEGADREPHRSKVDHYVELSLTDLQNGDVIEVRADIVSAEVLLAVKIKLANYYEWRCTTFQSVISTIDYENRTLTFSDEGWIGIVCQNADLSDSAGEPLTLADFVVNDAVAVKGFPLEDGTLRICELTLLAP